MTYEASKKNEEEADNVIIDDIVIQCPVCSKWVKYTYFVSCVARYIIDHKGSKFPDDESFILHCKKWAPKVCHCLYGGLFKRIYG